MEAGAGMKVFVRDLPDDRRAERETLLRIAGELDGLADRTDAAGRSEGPGLRADAAVLRAIAASKGNMLANPLGSAEEPSRG